MRSHLEALHDALTAHLDEHARLTLYEQLHAFHHTTERLARHDALIGEGLAEFADPVELLQTIPGIDRRSAGAILIELGPDLGVFALARHCAARAGLCPGNNESAGKRRGGRARRGNTTLREVLIECAHGAARTGQYQFQGYHKALTVRRGYKRATVAIAHKLLWGIFGVLSARTPCRDPHTDYEAMMVMRNAPRSLAMLRKHGIDPAA